jgi:hypothetical protein
MKKILILSLLSLSINCYAQDSTKFEFKFWRPIAEDLAAGPVFGSQKTWGGQMQAGIFYFQFAINNNYSPNQQYWDFAHKHKLGLTLRVAKNIEVYSGVGYAAFFREFDDDGVPLMQVEGKTKMLGSVGVGWDFNAIKFVIGYDTQPNEAYIGILLNQL